MTSLKSQRLLEQLRNLQFAPGQVKIAELGGGQDAPFEQAFSNLAHAYIKDRAPKLLDHEVGFQLIEKNQDNTKAVGVFGFKVGSQWIYVPVFFLNGDLKGHELMYMKSQDLFLPLKEEWVDYVLGKKPAVLGEGVNRNLSMLGIMPPNLYQLSRSPQKFASDQSMAKERLPIKMAGWARDFMPTLGYLVTTRVDEMERYKKLRGLPEFLKDAGEASFRDFLQKMSSYPTVVQAIDQLYGSNMLTGVARHLIAEKQAQASTSIVKDAALSVAGEKLPKNWNGRLQEPSKRNGGVGSYGREAWDKAQVGRRRSNAHVGQLGEGSGRVDPDPKAEQEKEGNYPGCGMHGRRKKKKLKKRASIISSILGPSESMPEGAKHKVVDKTMIEQNPDIVHDLKADERETLLKERVVFSDKRDDKDVTIAYNVQTPLKLQNPDHTGIYYVLMKPDRFEKCLVIMSPYTHRRRQNWCTVVSLDGEKDYVNTHPANVWIHGELDLQAWKKWLDDQPNADSVPLQRKRKSPGMGVDGDGGEYPDYRDRRAFVLLNPNGEGTAPFRAREDYEGGGDDSIVYDVRFEDHSSGHRPAYLPDHGLSDHDHYFCGSSYEDGEHLVLTKRPGSKITLRPGYCLVPDGFKRIQVRDEESLTKSESEPLRLGSLVDVQMALMSQTTPLRVVSDGRDVTVNGEQMKEKEAVIHLFRDHGLRKEAAEEIVQRAIRENKIEARLIYPDYIKAYWAKTAGDPSNDMIRGAPNAPSFPEPNIGYDPMTGGNIPTMQMSESNQKIPDMSASKTDRSVYQPFGPDSRSMQVAQEASRTGQKEVFDTAMLGSLLKTVRQENMVDRYLGDLTKGMDRIGRILFLYYWHGEEFEDRYGKQDMPEIEDGLRNTFEGVGDLVLRLKRKTIDPYMDDSGQIDLGPIANQ